MKEEDKFKVLIAEIDTRLLMNLEMVAREEDIQVVTCRDGLDALNLARKEMPDLLIIDVNVPGLKAFHVCNLLKADDRYRDIKIMMLTNMLSRDYEEKADRTGVFELIVKPFSNEEFLPHLQMAVGRCRWRGQKMIFLQTK